MINLDLSNVWTCVSLPELLGSEQEVFDAHNLLCSHQPDGPDFLGWLSMSPTICSRLVHGIQKSAERICADSDVLVVCGTGGAFQGARAAVELYCGTAHNLLGSSPQVLFVGQSLSGRQWLELSHLLEDRDYSLHLISPDGQALAPNVTARGLRWLMERKYGPKTKDRISVATRLGSPLHKMGQEEGYELFPLPKELGGLYSTLTPAALLPMAAAGIDPQAVLDGAMFTSRELDVRSFENPAWLYAAARKVLSGKGRSRELLCVFDHSLAAFGSWWKRQVWRHECREDLGLTVDTALLPGDLESMDQLLSSGRSPFFETLLHFSPISKKIPVEMDWKDYDGLGFLAGRSWDDVEAQAMETMVEVHNDAGVPILDLDLGDLTAESLGEMFYFFELSSALTACMCGVDPYELEEQAVRRALLRKLSGGTLPPV